MAIPNDGVASERTGWRDHDLGRRHRQCRNLIVREALP